MDKKIFLFGGSGFIGYHLHEHLKNLKGISSVILDIHPPKEKGLEYTVTDVRKKINLDLKANSQDVIFNLAATHRTPGHPSQEYFNTNILGAENVCNFAREHEINTIVFTSSIATYGVSEVEKSEKTLPMPDIPYGISKLTAEYIHKMWQLEKPEERRLIIVRPGVVFGKFENGNFTRLINSISKKRFFYPGRKDTIKACIYVKDLVGALMDMVEKEENGVKLYNMTYEPAPDIENICQKIAESGNLKPPKFKLPANILLSISKIAYYLFGIKSLHPARVRKLMISNNIEGKKLNLNYDLNFGLERGLSDWMRSTNFIEKKKIY